MSSVQNIYPYPEGRCALGEIFDCRYGVSVKICELRDTFTLVPDFSASFVRNLIPCGTYPYPTQHTLGRITSFDFVFNSRGERDRHDGCHPIVCHSDIMVSGRCCIGNTPDTGALWPWLPRSLDSTRQVDRIGECS